MKASRKDWGSAKRINVGLVVLLLVLTVIGGRAATDQLSGIAFVTPSFGQAPMSASAP